MAIINVTFDTKTKALTVTKDGVEMEDINSIDFYKRYEEDGFYMSIGSRKENKEDGTCEYNSLSANEKVLQKSFAKLF